MPSRRALAQVDVAPAVAAGHVVVGLGAHALLAADARAPACRSSPCRPASRRRPAAVAARDARRAADRQVHLAAGEVQVLGDLAARLAGARPPAPRRRAATPGCGTARSGAARSSAGSRSAQRGIDGRVIAAGRDHDLVGECSRRVGGRASKPPLRRRARRRVAATPFEQRRTERGDVVLEVARRSRLSA